MTILTLAAGLTGIFHINIRTSANSFLIGNLRRANICLDLKLSQESVNNDLQMELTHTGNDGLPGFRICIGFECGILFRQLHERNAHFFLSCLRFRFDGNTDDRLREFHRLKNDRMLFIAEGIACGSVFHTDHRGNITGINRITIFSVICVHLHDSAQTLACTLG